MSNQFQMKVPVNMYLLSQQQESDSVVENSVVVSVGRAPKPPENNPKVVDEDIKKQLMKVGGFRLIPSVSLQDKKHLKFSYPTVSVGVTHLVWAKVQAYFKNEPELLKFICDLIDEYTSTNSSVMAQLVRLEAQMPKIEQTVKYTDAMLAYIKTYLPIKPITDIVDLPDFKRGDIFDIIPSADAGMPFMATNRLAKCGDVPVYKKAIQLCNKYLVLLNHKDALKYDFKESFVNYMKDNPLEFLYITKRKFERIKRTDFHKKVRTYFVAPYALKLLFKWVSYYIRGQSLNFLEHENSSSAYKFSWANGGANKIMDFIFKYREEAKRTKKLIFKAICFGDDQLWTFTYPSGHVDVVAPDFVSMDTHVHNGVGVHEISRHIQSFVTPPSLVYQNVCRLLAKHAFSIDTLVNGAIVARKQYGLNSGIPLTTQLDIYGSLMSHSVVFSEVRSKNVGNKAMWSPGETDKILSRLDKIIPERVGLKFKEGTLEVQTFGPASKGNLNLKFLGYVIKFDDENDTYYPVPHDINMGWVSLALPSGPVTSDKAMAITMARAYGLLMSGYCFNPRFDELARQIFDYLKKQGTWMKVAPEFGELVMSKFDVEAFVTKHPYPPTRDEIIKFYKGDEGFYYNSKTEALVGDSVGNLQIPLVTPNSPLPLPPVVEDLVDYIDYNFDFSAPQPQTIKPVHVGGLLPKPRLASVAMRRTNAKAIKAKPAKDVYQKYIEKFDEPDRFDILEEEYRGHESEDDNLLELERLMDEEEQEYENRYSLGRHEKFHGIGDK